MDSRTLVKIVLATAANVCFGVYLWQCLKRAQEWAWRKIEQEEKDKDERNDGIDQKTR